MNIGCIILMACFFAFTESLNQTEIVVWPENSEVQVGERAVLNCSSRNWAGLTIDILWLKDGRVIDFEKQSRLINVYNQSLIIQQTDETDSGLYTCYAKTSTDSARATALLYIQDIPVQPAIVDLNCINSNFSAVLRWRPQSSNNSPTVAYIVSGFVTSQLTDSGTTINTFRVPGDQTELTIQLNPWTQTSFHVIMENTVGLSNPSYRSDECTMPATAPFHNPVNVYGKGNRPDNLIIYWKPMLPIEHNGPKLFYRIYYRLMVSNSTWTSVDIQLWTQSSFEISNQETFQPYIIKVEAHNDLGRAKEAVQEVVGFSGDGVPLSSPGNLKLLRIINENAAEIQWSTVDPSSIRGHFIGYKINLWDEITTKRKEITLDPLKTSIVLKGLTPLSFNYICIKVFNSAYEGPCSNPIAVYTYDSGRSARSKIDIPIIISNISEKVKFEIKPEGLGIYQMTWNISQLNLNYTLLGYKISWKPINESTLVQRTCESVIHQSNTTEVVLKILEPNTTYLVTFLILTAENQDGIQFYLHFSPPDDDFLTYARNLHFFGILKWFLAIIWVIAIILLIVLVIVIKKYCCRKKYKIKTPRDKVIGSKMASWTVNERENSFIQHPVDEEEENVELRSFLPKKEVSLPDLESQPLTTFTHQPTNDKTEISDTSLDNSDEDIDEFGRIKSYYLDEDREFQSLTNIFKEINNTEDKLEHSAL